MQFAQTLWVLNRHLRRVLFASFAGADPFLSRTTIDVAAPLQFDQVTAVAEDDAALHEVADWLALDVQQDLGWTWAITGAATGTFPAQPRRGKQGQCDPERFAGRNSLVKQQHRQRDSRQGIETWPSA